MENPEIFSQQFDIQSHHISANFDVNLQYLLGCMQTTADQHVDKMRIGWRELHQHNCFWAIYRMGLQIEKLPRKYDRITINTWANPPQNLLQPRSFEVINQNGELLLRAQSLWIIMSSIDFRPQTIEEVIGTGIPDLMGAAEPFKMNLKVPPVPAGDAYTSLPSQKVLYSDIDANIHVNNTNYVRWLLDSYDFEFLQKHRVKEVVINYTKQAQFGDEYALFKQEKDELTHFCSVINSKNGEEFCKMKVVFS